MWDLIKTVLNSYLHETIQVQKLLDIDTGMLCLKVAISLCMSLFSFNYFFIHV